MAKERTASYGAGRRGFYWAVTVSERGQAVIPAQARRDHGIAPGGKLLILGDPSKDSR
ncbi:AbrB/MazE/SpoVT family DNA-binding domain-containing protein [Nocardia asteroides]